MDSTVVYDVASSVLAAVADALEAAEFPAPCRVGVVPGQIVDDSCCLMEGEDGCGGQLAATFTRVYSGREPWPSGVGIPVTPGCQTGAPTVDLTVRLSFCVAASTDQSPIPEMAALDASGRDAGKAAFAMLCGAEGWAAEWPERTIVRGVVPSGPQSGCLGLDLTLTVELANVAAPPPPP